MADHNYLLAAISGYDESVRLLPEDAQANLQAQLWQLLARQTQLYTMGDSSSVPMETAQELLESICFCIGANLKTHPPQSSLLQEKSLDELFTAGSRDVWALTEEGKSLLAVAQKTALDIDNTSYHDTLREIPGFFKQYDMRFFAQDIPCMIDYQLCHAVSNDLLGIEYINEYLRRFIMENRFCQYFEASRIVSLLQAYCADYKGLLINIFEPVFTNAIGLALLNRDVASLEITEADRTELSKLLRPWNAELMEKSMRQAVNRICAVLGLWDTQIRAYLHQSSNSLLHQIKQTNPDFLHNLFLSI